MTEQKRRRSPWAYIVALGLAIFLFLSGLYSGRKWTEAEYAEIANRSVGIVDSLNIVNGRLQDSIKLLSVQEVKAAEIVYRWRTKYDTVHIKDDLSEIIMGLNRIAETPPVE